MSDPVPPPQHERAPMPSGLSLRFKTSKSTEGKSSEAARVTTFKTSAGVVNTHTQRDESQEGVAHQPTQKLTVQLKRIGTVEASQAATPRHELSSPTCGRGDGGGGVFADESRVGTSTAMVRPLTSQHNADNEEDDGNAPPPQRSSTSTPPTKPFDAFAERETPSGDEVGGHKSETPGTRLKEMQSMFPTHPPPGNTAGEEQVGAAEGEGDDARPPSGDAGSIAGVSQEEESVTTEDTLRNPGSGFASRASGRSPTPTSMGVPFQYPAQGCRIHPRARVPLPEASAVPSRMVPSTSTVSNRYEILQKVGEGTYGEVNRGRDKSTNKIVALKRIKTLEGLDGFPLTSVREVIALKFLTKSLRADEKNHFVMLLDVVLSDDFQSVYLVFDFVEHSLAGLALRMRELNFSEVDIGTIFVRILRGVHILHQRGIMHRDLKLDNILVGRQAQVQLCDFGLSVPLGSNRQCLTPSLINLLYRPPEMLLGSLSYSPAVDVWSLGCMLAQMILGEPPFLVRDKDKAGSELGQLEAITAVLGPYTDELSRDMRGTVERRYNKLTLEMLRCIPDEKHQQRQSSNARGNRFSNWMRRHHRLDRRAPLPDDLYEALDAALQVDPSKRATVEVLLKLPYFQRMARNEVHTIRSIEGRLERLPSSHLLSVKQEINDRARAHQHRTH